MAGIDEVVLKADDDDDFEMGDDVEGLKSRVTRKKGRGFGDQGQGYTGDYDQVEDMGDGPGPLRSVEGWIVFVRNLHEEAQEDDVNDTFGQYGAIKNIHINLDRRTGFLKGYALVEYEKYREAAKAIDNLNGASMLGQRIDVDWAFVKPQPERGGRRVGRR